MSQALPFLGPSGANRNAHEGAESLGAHCEGPFLNPTKNGVHNIDVLIEAHSFTDIEACYGAENLRPQREGEPIPVKMITAAPERGQMMKLIPEIASRGIIYSVGHSEATYEEASEAVGRGATMITHLFNAMRPLHHRNPGIFGVLGKAENLARPYFGIISDGIHLHPTTIKIAFNAHPDGFILVTDAMHLVGLPDGAYPWTNGEQTCNIIKKGSKLLLENSDTIAGRYVSKMPGYLTCPLSSFPSCGGDRAMALLLLHAPLTYICTCINAAMHSRNKLTILAQLHHVA